MGRDDVAGEQRQTRASTFDADREVGRAQALALRADGFWKPARVCWICSQVAQELRRSELVF